MTDTLGAVKTPIAAKSDYVICRARISRDSYKKLRWEARHNRKIPLDDLLGILIDSAMEAGAELGPDYPATED